MPAEHEPEPGLQRSTSQVFPSVLRVHPKNSVVALPVTQLPLEQVRGVQVRDWVASSSHGVR